MHVTHAAVACLGSCPQCQELHGLYTRSYDHKHPMASTLSPTLCFLVVRLRSKARFVPLLKQGKLFEGPLPRLRRNSLSTGSCCHMVKQRNGGCMVCRAHLGGFTYHWILTIRNGECEQTCLKPASKFIIPEHAGWGIIRSVRSICRCGGRQQMMSKYGMDLKE
jgi:hypothetical protein